MKLSIPSFIVVVAIGLFAATHAQSATGPFPINDWPTGRDPSKTVHFVTSDGVLTSPGAGWSETMTILTGGDQVTQNITIGGFVGKKVTGSYLNIADNEYSAWADKEFIDILVQAYGDASLYNASGEPRNFNFLTGTLPELSAPNGGQVPVEARNQKWNWILFRIPNGVRPSDGSHFVGTIPANAAGDTSHGGVNGGTIRLQTVPNMIVRVVAFGEQGAFGEPEDINKFAAANACDPEPNTNLAGIDVSANVASHIQVLNDKDQTVTYSTGVGPANDKRRVVVPTGQYLNFAITANYLGQPCNDPRAVKVCIEFYDDPDFAGKSVRFGPEAYATDDQTGVATFAEDKRAVLEGSGKWIRRSWIVPSVNLRGVNTGTLTAGPRLISENGAVAVSNFQIGILRSGNHPLAGQDPLSDCYQDPLICTDAYGSFAELDLAKDIKNGLDVGTSAGDQNMVVEEAGPANDRRLAVRPAFEDGAPGFAHQYLNFAITGEAFGPNSQPPTQFAICATYYDDPALTGATFRPEVYISERNGSDTFAFTAGTVAVALEGTGAWRTAYWEIPDMKFNGVNQGPQAAARFLASGKIFITSLRYAVIRPCGPNAGKNLIADCAPKPNTTALAVTLTADARVRLSWPASATGFVLQSTPSIGGAWALVPDAPVLDGDRLTVTVTPSGTQFYRLMSP